MAAGAVVGGIVALVPLVLCVWWCFKRRQTARELASASGAGATTTGDANSQKGEPEHPTRPMLFTLTGAHTSTSKSGATGSQSGVTDGMMASPSTPGEHDVVAFVQRHQLQALRIRWSNIVIGRTLGKGGFGEVFRGKWMGNDVAVKCLDALSPVAADQLRHEALVMCELLHPCIASVLGLVDDGEHLALVMRYYKAGTMAQLLRSPSYADFPLSSRLRMVLQVATGMVRLHGAEPAPILHGDLKTSNLLLEEEPLPVRPGRRAPTHRTFKCLLADFGLAAVARVQDSGDSAASYTSAPGLECALTVAISPPEVLANPRAPRKPPVDVYAMGIVMLEILSGRSAWHGMTSAQIAQLVRSGRRPPVPDWIPRGIAAIIQSCWADDPVARPAFTDVVCALQRELDVRELQGASEYTGGGQLDTTSTVTVTYGMY